MLDVGLEPSGQQKAPSGNLGKLVNFTYASRLPKGRSLCFWLFSESLADIRIYFWSNFIITQFLLPKWHSWQSPYPSVLDFWKIKLEKSSSTNWIFKTNWIFTVCVACKNQFRNWFCRLKIQFSSSNLIFQTWFFKNQVQMDRAFVLKLLWAD